MLHFKSDCSLLGEETVFATPQLAASGAFEGFRVMVTPPGEEGAANLIRVGAQLILSNAFHAPPTCSQPKTTASHPSQPPKFPRSTRVYPACRCAGGRSRSAGASW